ncbi:YciI family protein [Formosa algae]|uniref:Uncharacterized protein YciI n=1 Tax=Formosa algae TaxID=225843 RepID=A0A9X1C805_9FLAO|nr:YciI family protein [Formosa algae]MBP1838486.1 uncharacterized protein YciI [Formosa algae]MDQ0334621.1 uncharacterized protein YciI [Formosa algae]OEI79153.1 hypothetical protein AST99_16030 [Formosa algae]
MKHSILIIVVLMLFNCKKAEHATPISTAVQDSLEIDLATDTISINTEKIVPVKSYKEIKAELTAKGYQTYDYVDEETKDTILMQQYFIAFLKNGTIRTQNEEEAQELQDQHLAHLTKMYKLGYADISGPFGDDSNMRGITIYNVPTLKMADSLANADPMVKAGRLEIEVHPWWAAKGISLR